MSAVTQFLENHPSVVFNEDVHGLCKPLELLDINYFSHLRMENSGEFSALPTSISLMKNYLEKSYYNADIHVDPKHCHLLNCLMWDMLDLKGKAREMLQDAHDQNIKHMFTLIKPGKDHVDYYHFGSPLAENSMNQRYVNHLDLLETFIAYFTDKMQALPHLAKAYDLKVSMNQPDPSLYELDLLNSLSLEDKMDFLDQIQMNKISHKNLLTKRELDYVPLILLGLTSKEIARKLNISVRTVEEYTAVLREKLRARNKMDLVAKLLELRKQA